MKVKRIIYIGCLLLFSLQGYAQKETWNWLFGTKAGLTFQPDELRSFNATGLDGTSNATLYDLPGAFITEMTNNEGVFSISDKEGNLLFYSNGMRIWKADGTEIYSNLGGHNSSAQSGIVVSYPGDKTKYICIGLGEKDEDRMNYVVVQANSPTDVSVIGTLETFSGHSGILGESMSAVRHANGFDWWIVAVGKGSPTYLNAWLVTATGVNSSAPEVITDTGINVEANHANGYLKFTPDGKYFVYPTHSEDLIYGEFNTLTGGFTNIQSIEGGRYGAEFSPNQKYLYLTSIDNNAPYSGLFVWDFEALLEGTVSSPMKSISTSNPGALQLDPFGRIWGTFHSSRNMLLIENPDEPTNLKLYKLENFVAETTSGQYGLPSFSASWFYMPIKGADSFCIKDTQTYTFKISKKMGVYELSHTEWDFGDGSPVVTDDTFTGEQTQSHTYTKRGNYTITVRSFLEGDGLEVPTLRRTLKVKAKSCSLPVNHNITLMGY